MKEEGRKTSFGRKWNGRGLVGKEEGRGGEETEVVSIEGRDKDDKSALKDFLRRRKIWDRIYPSIAVYSAEVV